MSAWLLGSDTMTNIRNYMVDIMVKDQHMAQDTAIQTATKTVMDFNLMNRYAIKCRYGSNSMPVKLGEYVPNSISKFQFFKSLVCLEYQCSEGDTEKKKDRIWKCLKEHIGAVATEIAWQHPEVNNANWG